MKILLIQGYLGRKEPPVMPQGLLMIATVLKGHEVNVYDPNVAEDPYGELEMKLTGFRPEVVGISIRNIDNQQGIEFFYYFKTLRPTLSIIKEHVPDAYIMAGGAGFSMFGKRVMEKLPEVDFGVYLEGEETVPDLMENLKTPERVKGLYYREKGRIVFTGQRVLPDFTNLPYPNKDFIDLKKYDCDGGIGIQTKRGCAYRCSYCTYPALNGNRLRLREPEHVVDEVEDLLNRGFNSFMFADALFTVPIKHAEEICREMMRRGLKTRWFAWAEPKLITKHFILLARDAGCVFLAYSPDAISDSALGVLKKNTHEKDLLKVYGYAKEIDGIKTGFGLFVCPPEETLRGFIKSTSFYIRANIVLKLKRRGGVGLNWIRIEPDTGVYRYALSKGVISEETELLPDPEEVKTGEIFYVHPPLRFYSKLTRAALVILNYSVGILKKWRLAYGK